MWFYFISIFLFFQHQTQFTNKAKIIKLKHQNYLLKYYPTQSKATPTQSNITTKNFSNRYSYPRLLIPSKYPSFYNLKTYSERCKYLTDLEH